jgi:hypothetical protein
LNYWILYSDEATYPKLVDRKGHHFFHPLYYADESLREHIKKLKDEEDRLIYRVPPPLHYEVSIDSAYDDHFDAPYYRGESIMRDDLIEAILSTGAGNIETFETIVTDTRSGRQFTNYKYVHIIGEADILDETVINRNAGRRDISPEKNLGGLHIARLKSHHEIVIDRAVREAIEKRGIENIRYQKRYSLFIEEENFDD